MDLINAIHAGDVEKIKHCLAADASLIDKADAQGNTLLHYAVAQQDLELIRWLIERGACTTEKNHQGETAGEWFRLFFAVRCNFNLDFLKELSQAIQRDDQGFVAAASKGGVSPALRFSQAKTLLHLAIDYQKVASVTALLAGYSHITVKRFLNLRDSQGVTPLALAQQHCQLGSPVAQGIVDYLQKRQCALAEEGTASALQTHRLPPFSYEPLGVEQNELQALSDIFSYRYGLPNVVKLNPLRSTIVKLACKLCYQAFFHCTHSIGIKVPRCDGRKAFPIENLFEKLFGRWMSRERDSFGLKLHSVFFYLYSVINQKKVEQFIEFSEELADSGGWTSPSLNKIYLNHRVKGGLMSVVATLIHEVTHQVAGSYDFFSTVYSNDSEGFSMHLDHAYQLAAKGTAGALTLATRRLLEARQLLETGNVPNWRKELRHWMALHSAETLTVAILAVATLSTGFAEYDSRPRALVIKPQFLQTLCGEATPLKPLIPERPLVVKKLKVNASGRSDGEETVISTADSGFSSSAGGETSMDWDSSAASEPVASTSRLTQAVAAVVQTSEKTSASPLALSPKAPTQTNPSALSFPDKPPQCNTM